jgi:hypothetical protein
LLSGGKLFERRSNGWWVWDPGVAGAGAPSSVLRFDGECQAVDNLMWLTSADGTLWRIEPSRVSRPVKFEALDDAVVTDGMLAVLEPDRLWIGPDSWQSWLFPGPMPKELSASGGFLWMASGDQLLRFDGDIFVEVAHGLEESIARIAAHSGGVWVEGKSSLCHQATAPMVRAEGVRPYVRSIEFDYPFALLPSVAAMDVTATLDGEAVVLELDTETGWLQGQARLDQVGWHSLELEVQGSGKVGSRSILLKRLPESELSWQSDIAPIYQQHCSGAECHKPGSSSEAPDLSSYDAWLVRSEKIRERVVETKTMPPPSSVSADWGDDRIEAISQWLEGGMLP